MKPPKTGIREIVERARAGDQVAMALIIETRKQADGGNVKAQKSLKAMNKYIAAHPPSTMAGDERLSVDTNPAAQAAVWSARSSDPQTFASTVAQAAPYMGPWALVCAIFHGPQLVKGSPLMVAAAMPKSKIAACTRKAYKLQRLADSRVPISSYCPYTACELGE